MRVVLKTTNQMIPQGIIESFDATTALELLL